MLLSVSNLGFHVKRHVKRKACAQLASAPFGTVAKLAIKCIGSTKASDKGMCCSFADGFSVSDVDWDMHDGHYRVLLHGEWIDVPDTSVTRPNPYGPAVVWPYMDDKGNTNIRFLPGTSA